MIRLRTRRGTPLYALVVPRRATNRLPRGRFRYPHGQRVDNDALCFPLESHRHWSVWTFHPRSGCLHDDEATRCGRLSAA